MKKTLVVVRVISSTQAYASSERELHKGNVHVDTMSMGRGTKGYQIAHIVRVNYEDMINIS